MNTLRLLPHAKGSRRSTDMSGEHWLIFPGCLDETGHVRTIYPKLQGPTPMTNPLERWPGYDEQSWAQRFAELDRRYSAFAVDAAKAIQELTKERPTLQAEAMREAAAKLVYEGMRWAKGQPGEAPPWVERGNSLAQEQARRLAGRITEALPLPAALDAGEQSELIEALTSIGAYIDKHGGGGITKVLSNGKRYAVLDYGDYEAQLINREKRGAEKVAPPSASGGG